MNFTTFVLAKGQLLTIVCQNQFRSFKAVNRMTKLLACRDRNMIEILLSGSLNSDTHETE